MDLGQRRSFVSASSMRSSIIGLVVGAVLGVVLGVTVIAPRLQRAEPHGAAKEQAPVPTPTDIAKQLPRALVAKPAVSLRMTSGFPLETPIAGALARRIDSRIWEVSHGQIEIRFSCAGSGHLRRLRFVGGGRIGRDRRGLHGTGNGECARPVDLYRRSVRPR